MSDAARIKTLEVELDRERHARAVMQRLAFALKELVPRAFEEGFKRRAPDTDEPWLIDWLQSDSKRALEPMLRGGAFDGDRGAPDFSHAHPKED